MTKAKTSTTKRAKRQRAVPTDDTELLSIQEAADVLGVSYSTCWRLMRDGALPAKLIRSATRIRRDDLSAYIASLPDAHATT